MDGILESNIPILQGDLTDNMLNQLYKTIDRLVERERHVTGYWFCFLDVNECNTAQRWNLFFDCKVQFSLPLYHTKDVAKCRKLETHLIERYLAEEKLNQQQHNLKERCFTNDLDQAYGVHKARSGEGNFVLYLGLQFNRECKKIVTDKGYYYSLC